MSLTNYILIIPICVFASQAGLYLLVGFKEKELRLILLGFFYGLTGFLCLNSQFTSDLTDIPISTVQTVVLSAGVVILFVDKVTAKSRKTDKES